MTSKAVQVYDLIEKKAGSNSFLQTLSSVFGFPYTTIVDVGVFFTHYGPMLNKIRNIYGLPDADKSSLKTIVLGCKKELLADIVIDKILGNLPVIGIPANLMCAKAMTWRLGILFGILSSRGEEINAENVDLAIKVIRNAFPQKQSLLFKKPSAVVVEKLLTAVEGISQESLNDKLMKILDSVAA